MVRIPSLFVLVASAILIAPGWAQDERVGAKTGSPVERVHLRQRILVVQPVILRDDDGENPAAHSLPKRLVDQVYAKADVEFLYLPPRYWDYGAGRRGEVDLNTIVGRGQTSGLIRRDPRVETLLFVSAVDGNKGPLGRGLQNGNICFVCLGPHPERNDPGMEAFVVAHEVGHCLNLLHSVDDPRVPDDLVNLQGGGPFAQRLAVEGLHDSQRDTVLASALVNDHIRFYSRGESAARLVDETWEPYLTNAHPDMLRFVLGRAASSSIPEDPGARLALARQEHVGFAAGFTTEEEQLLAGAVHRLSDLVGDDWPLVARLPWNFVKVRDGFCQGMPHTRGLSIVLGPRALARMAEDAEYGLTLLLHEKMHVIERLCPEAFAPLFRDLGFLSVQLAPSVAEDLNLAQNPDALSLDWAISVDGEPCLLATSIVHEGDKLVFRETLHRLELKANGRSELGVGVDPEKAAAFKQRFGIRSGHDHPNEVAAYLAEHLLRTDYLGQALEPSDAAAAQVQLARVGFLEILGSVYSVSDR